MKILYIIITTLLLVIMFPFFIWFIYNKIEYMDVNTKSIIKYTDSIHKDTFQYKISKNFINCSDFSKQYIESIVNVPKKYQKMLQIYKNIYIKILKQYKIKNIPIEIKMSLNNLENGMTFTINNWIVLSNNKLEQIYKKKNIDISFIELILHEFIHILQRFNQTKFDSFYKQNYLFLYKKIHVTNLPNIIRKKTMLNPDINQLIWTYKIGNNIYYPVYEIINQNEQIKFKESLYNIKTLKATRSSIKQLLVSYNLFNSTEQPIYPSEYGLHHPNELFAIQISKFFVDKKSNKYSNKFIQFLRSL